MYNCNRRLRAWATSKKCALSAVCKRSGEPPLTPQSFFFDYDFRCRNCITRWTIFTSHTMHRISSHHYNNVLINKFPKIAARVMVRSEFTTSTIDYPDNAHNTYNMPRIIMMIAQIIFKKTHTKQTPVCESQPVAPSHPHNAHHT